MSTEVIIAIISASAVVLAAIITGIFKLIDSKTKDDKNQNIKGNGNMQAGGSITVSGGISVNEKPTDKG